MSSAVGHERRAHRVLARLGWAVVGALVVVAIGAALVWSGRVVVDDPAVSDPSTPPVQALTATVEEGGAELVLERVGTMTYPAIRSLAAPRAGTVTRVDHRSGGVIDENQPVVHIDEIPFVLAEGALPLYRTLEVGVEGEDVRQLQVFLSRRDLWRYEHDGRFTSDVAGAVKLWQKQIGAPETGTVGGDLMAFVPELPAVLNIATGVAVGGQIGSGTAIAELAATTPTVTVALDPTEATSLALPNPVEVSGGGTTVPGILVEVGPGESDTGETLSGVIEVDPEACAVSCAEIASRSGGQVRVAIVVQERVEGLVVPPAAVEEAADGTMFVVLDATGRRRTVEVLGRSPNALVIRGVVAGDVVRLPG